jgi:hypothetical protein
MAGCSFAARWESFDMSINVLLVDDHTVVREGLRFSSKQRGTLR